MRKSTKGFTLVEIMIVVVIIGLLAVLAIPAFNRVRSTAQRNSVTNNLRQVANAADQYFIQNGVTQVQITSLIGSTSFIKTLQPVAKEDYTSLGTIEQGFTQLTVTVPGLGESVVYAQ